MSNTDPKIDAAAETDNARITRLELVLNNLHSRAIRIEVRLSKLLIHHGLNFDGRTLAEAAALDTPLPPICTGDLPG